MMSPRSFLVSRQNERPSPSRTILSPLLTYSSSPTPPVKRSYETQSKSISSATSINVTPSSTMATSKLRSTQTSPSPCPSPPNTLTRPTTPTSPVQIPSAHRSRETAHPQKQHRHHVTRRDQVDAKPRNAHSPDAIPASVAALLAVTSIPPPRRGRVQRKRRSDSEKRMTVESIIEQAQESEKELSDRLLSGRSPMDMLLSAPEDLDADDISISDSTLGSPLSTRTDSGESVPSLGDSYTTSTLSSVDTPVSSPRSRKSLPTPIYLEPISFPGEHDDHPLSSPETEIDQLDFRVFAESPAQDKETRMRFPFTPLKSAFKSNLTASLKALKQAARSFSSLNFPSIPPEDFLTRSILTIDPRVPFTDERRPPPLEEEPTPALRRYFNPTTNTRLEQPGPLPSAAPGHDFTASIQMQTYKIQRARSAPPAGRIPKPSPTVSGGKTVSVAESRREHKIVSLEPSLPGPRQREMRENSDFIRIAVMEMAMRKRGKLDEQRPGRARWALPPRKVSTTPYEIRDDGVPARWVAATY